jgi:hypothetical protein
VNANSGEWQLAQETLPSEDRRLSKNNSQPSSAFSGVYELSSGQKISTSPRGIFGPSGGNIGLASALVWPWPINIDGATKPIRPIATMKNAQRNLHWQRMGKPLMSVAGEIVRRLLRIPVMSQFE